MKPQTLRRLFLVLLLVTQSVTASFLDTLNQETPSLGSGAKFLPADQAFLFDALPIKERQLLFRWTMPPGYYLYRHSFVFSSSNGQLAQAQFPPGVAKYDEYLGDFEIYSDQLEVKVPIAQSAHSIQVRVEYQGCAPSGYCYPPMVQTLTFTVTPTPIKAQPASSLPDLALSDNPDRLSQILAEQPIAYNLLIFLGLGILLAFTPCVLPMIPILSGILLGQEQRVSKQRAFFLALLYVLGVAFTYAIGGALAGLAGRSFQNAFQQPWLLSSMAVLFLLLALSLLGGFDLRLPSLLADKIHQLNHRARGGTWLGVWAMGVLSALVISPCVTAPLVGALAFIGQTGEVWLGGLALFCLGFGMGLPLIIAATFGAHWLPRTGAWMNAIKRFFALLLIGLAITLVARFLPGAVILGLWGILALGSGVLIGVWRSPRSSAEKCCQVLAVLLIGLGTVYLLGGAMGNTDFLQPLRYRPSHPAPNTSSHPYPYTAVKSVAELERALSEAHQPVLVIFAADWCLTCHRMERQVLSQPEVLAYLQKMTVLRADVTANDEIDQALQRHLGVFAPPTYLFFPPTGTEARKLRLVAETSKSVFIQHLQRLFVK